MRSAQDLPPPHRLGGGGADETLDGFFDGELELFQTRRGYRVNVDALLLAHFAFVRGAQVQGPVVDLGTGSGIIPLLIAKRRLDWRFACVELQPQLCALARRNVEHNRLHHRISVVRGDLRQAPRLFSRGSFDLVICNPPYQPRRSGLLPPNPEKAIARHQLWCDLDDVMRAAAHLAGDGGGAVLIYPAEKVPELEAAARRQALSVSARREVFPRGGASAGRALVELRPGFGQPVERLPSLVLHAAESSRHLPESQAIVDGRW